MYMENLRVPIPEGSRITKDKLVQHVLRTVGGGAKEEWSTIGKLPPEGDLYDEDNNRLMVPNGIYHLLFGGYYREVSEKDPDNIPPFYIRGAKVGNFALFLGAVTKAGLYDLLIDIFGVVTANALLDLAMYYNLGDRLDLEWLDSTLEDQIVFSVRPHTKEWYQERVNAIEDDQIDAFMQRWARRRQRSAHRDTTIHLDASAKPVSRDLFWEDEAWSALIVCETGGAYPCLPLAYEFFYEGTPDRGAALIAQGSFEDMGLKPKCFIGGTSPLKSEFFAAAEIIHMPWLLNMKNTFLAYEDMLARHEEDLFQGHGTPITAREPMVAVREEDVLLFGPDTLDPDRRGCVALYCIPREAKKGREFMQQCLDQAYPEACAMLDKIQNSSEKDTLPIPDPARDPKQAEDEDEITAEVQALRVLYRAVCKAGGQFYSPEPHAWQCFQMEYHPEEGRYHLVINQDEVRYLRSRGNYIAMASSEPMDLQAISDDYPLSIYLTDNLFTTAFSAMHAQLNSPPPDFDDISNWFFTAFLSDIVRALLLPAYRAFEAEKDGEIRAKELEDYPEEKREEKAKDFEVQICIDDMLQWLDDVKFSYFTGKDRDPFLAYNGNTAGVRGAVLQAVGVPTSSPPLFLDLVNAGEDPHAIKILRQMKRTIPKKRGRPAGSKNRPKPDAGKN